MRTRIIFFMIVLLAVSASGAFAQRNVTPAIVRDPLMEADANHNLDVAWNYFKLKKAYKATLMRFEETFEAYPDFSKIDEFLYMAGMSSYYLADNKGKQKIDLKTDKDKKKYAPAKLRDDAKMYLTMIVDKYPESRYRDDAKKTLALLQSPK